MCAACGRSGPEMGEAFTMEIRKGIPVVAFRRLLTTALLVTPQLNG